LSRRCFVSDRRIPELSGATVAVAVVARGVAVAMVAAPVMVAEQAADPCHSLRSE
jgi:hypothetical protein